MVLTTGYRQGFQINCRWTDQSPTTLAVIVLQREKRLILEQEVGRVKQQDHLAAGNKMKLEQSDKFVVMDLLAKGWVSIHKTSTGEQRIRLVE